MDAGTECWLPLTTEPVSAGRQLLLSGISKEIITQECLDSKLSLQCSHNTAVLWSSRARIEPRACAAWHWFSPWAPSEPWHYHLGTQCMWCWCRDSSWPHLLNIHPIYAFYSQRYDKERGLDKHWGMLDLCSQDLCHVMLQSGLLHPSRPLTRAHFSVTPPHRGAHFTVRDNIWNQRGCMWPGLYFRKYLHEFLCINCQTPLDCIWIPIFSPVLFSCPPWSWSISQPGALGLEGVCRLMHPHISICKDG